MSKKKTCWYVMDSGNGTPSWLVREPQSLSPEFIGVFAISLGLERYLGPFTTKEKAVRELKKHKFDPDFQITTTEKMLSE